MVKIEKFTRRLLLLVLVIVLSACSSSKDDPINTPINNNPLTPIETILPIVEDSLPAIQTVTFGERGQFIVNGKPFLPIMSWVQHYRNMWNSYANLKEHKFNTFMGTINSRVPLQHANEAQEYGCYAVVKQHEPDQIEPAVGHTHILAWHHRDEPDLYSTTLNGPRTSGDAIKQNYDLLQSNDINRPVFVTFTSHFMEEFTNRYSTQEKNAIYQPYITASDVVGFDLYPFYQWNRPGWLNRPASGVKQLKSMSNGKPVYAWIEAVVGGSAITPSRQVPLYPEHTRFQVWSALIEGATAYGYFTHVLHPDLTYHEFGLTDEMKTEVKRLNGQIARLAPVILAPYSRRIISVEITTTDNTTLLNRFMATEYKNNLFIFVQNADLGPNAEDLQQAQPIDPRAGRAVISVNGLTEGTIIEVVDENRTINASEGFFTDDFGALGEHIYRIQL